MSTYGILGLTFLHFCTLAQALIGGELFLDPTPGELARAGGAATVCALASSGCVTHTVLRGGWGGADGGAEEGLETCLDACRVLDGALRAALAAATAPQAKHALAGRAT
jgi:hypothetical protein